MVQLRYHYWFGMLVLAEHLLPLQSVYSQIKWSLYPVHKIVVSSFLFTLYQLKSYLLIKVSFFFFYFNWLFVLNTQPIFPHMVLFDIRCIAVKVNGLRQSTAR